MEILLSSEDRVGQRKRAKSRKFQIKEQQCSLMIGCIGHFCSGFLCFSQALAPFVYFQCTGLHPIFVGSSYSNFLFAYQTIIIMEFILGNLFMLGENDVILQTWHELEHRNSTNHLDNYLHYS